MHILAYSSFIFEKKNRELLLGLWSTGPSNLCQVNLNL